MDIADRARQLRHDRKPFVHATVVRAQHPTSAQAGDEAILLADGTIEGFVGGQCARDSVRKAAMGALQAGESVLLRVLPDGDLHFPDAPGACVVVNPCLSGGALEIFLAPQIPAPLVRIVGETPIAQALAQICSVLGYEVRSDRDGGFDGATAVVIATHGGPEAETVRAALDAGVGYIGLVASQARGASVIDMLELGCCERGRVHTPVGLPIGAKTPAEIAVAIAAEMISGIRTGGLTVSEPAACGVEIELQPAAPSGADTAIDPICGMTVTIANGTPHLQIGGQDFWFCCPGCRTRYAAQAGA